MIAYHLNCTKRNIPDYALVENHPKFVFDGHYGYDCDSCGVSLANLSALVPTYPETRGADGFWSFDNNGHFEELAIDRIDR